MTIWLFWWSGTAVEKLAVIYQVVNDMRKSNKLISNLAATADVVNLLSGGLSEPSIKLLQLTDAHQLEIKVPGVDAKTLSVEINNNALTIYQLLEIATAGELIRIPRLIYSHVIPHFIDVKAVEASVGSEKRLLVRLPFNERANGYQRKIRIKGS